MKSRVEGKATIESSDGDRVAGPEGRAGREGDSSGFEMRADFLAKQPGFAALPTVGDGVRMASLPKLGRSSRSLY